MELKENFKHLGDFSATEPVHSRFMQCLNCRVSWVGCYDNFTCPICGEGEIPKFGSKDFVKLDFENYRMKSNES